MRHVNVDDEHNRALGDHQVPRLIIKVILVWFNRSRCALNAYVSISSHTNDLRWSHGGAIMFPMVLFIPM